MIECALIGALSGLAVFGVCSYISARRNEAQHTAEALRAWQGDQPRQEQPTCLHDPDDPIGGTRIRASTRPNGR